jgi:hypothetical protein
MIMKKIDYNTYTYKGYVASYFPHPKLYGNYEIYDEYENFICRQITLKDCEEYIDFIIK